MSAPCKGIAATITPPFSPLTACSRPILLTCTRTTRSHSGMRIPPGLFSPATHSCMPILLRSPLIRGSAWQWLASLSAGRRRQLLRQVAENQREIAKLVRRHSANHEPLYGIIEAERAWALGHGDRAKYLFDRGIQLCQAQGFLAHEANTNESFGLMLLQLGEAAEARRRLSRSRRSVSADGRAGEGLADGTRLRAGSIRRLRLPGMLR